MSRRPARRGVDERAGELRGRDAREELVRPEVWTRVPSEGPSRTYYDRAAIKEPVWIWSVPAYFYTGGAAGAAMALGAAAQLLGGRGTRRLVRRCRWIAAAGAASGTAFLVLDLGRPSRFLNMLRVFRPTSPMSMGSWMLAAAAPLAGASAVLDGTALGDAAGLAAGVAGLPLAGYTGVLLAGTAVPVWQHARRTLPVLFTASSVAAAGALLEASELDDVEYRIVRRFSIAGSVAELAAGFALEREAAGAGRAAAPLHEGVSGALWSAARASTAAGLALTLLPGRSRAKRAAAAALGTAGAIAVRFSLFHAGRTSARDPRATFEPQRAGLGAAEVTGMPAVTGPEGAR